jgi:hypothetical protein
MIYYDVETLINCFTLCAENDEDRKWQFEISERRNDFHALREWVDELIDSGEEMCGFNNLHFDCQVLIGGIYCLALDTADKIYAWAQRIINDSAAKQPELVPQIDLYKIHHFDNKARVTGLKMLEFVMRMDSIEEMPFPHDQPIAPENIPALLTYNWHDVKATRRFAGQSADKIALRRELSAIYSPAFMNYSDSKLGKQIIIRELEKAGIRCYDKKGPRQTHRDVGIPVSHILLPQIAFKSRAFNEVLGDYRGLVVHDTNGSFSHSVTARGVEFVFALGGIHASVENRIFESDEQYEIVDADVTSYYPNMSIRHGFYPEHLGAEFMPVYEGIYNRRAEYKKAGNKTRSEAYKLGLNSVYGDSNSMYSPFYDPQMTMSITINGQLFMAMMCEKLMWVKEFEIIQANTDGCTFRIPRAMRSRYDEICAEWMHLSKLDLEFVNYDRMWVRDVNNYLAQSGNKVKRKGAYDYEKEWHKDHSFLVIQKAVEENLVNGKSLDEFIKNHSDVFDFMGRVKLDKNSRIEWDTKTFKGVVRYIVTKDGKEMVKLMPALGVPGAWKRKRICDRKVWDQLVLDTRNRLGGNPSYDECLLQMDWDSRVHMGTLKTRGRYEERRTRINAGQKVTVCNTIDRQAFNIDYDFYIREARKLTDVFAKN